MKSIQDLACEVGLCMANDEWPLMQRFHTLAIEQEHKRLLEGSGETYGYDVYVEKSAIGYIAYSLEEPQLVDDLTNMGATYTPLYTADQMAAAVLRATLAERERCADICDVHATGWEQNSGVNPQAGFIASSNCAAAIREQR